jgi:iron complex outermembrane receptor protein
MRSGEPRWPVVLFALLFPLAGAPSLTFAQEAPAETEAAQPAAEEPEPPRFDSEIVVTGSRSQPRSVTESMVPIDVVSAHDFSDLGEPDLSYQLRTLVPSYNVNSQPVNDAAIVVRPANLRNLAPDHTLVLVNGKRRHRASVIQWTGNGVADGSQGPDVSPIPSIALRQVEVLRDGASAQYGSDAIAGVLNFLLKDDSQGGSIEVRGGGYQEGDGETFSVAGNVGLPMGENGFANLSLDYGESDPTSRSVQRDDAALLISNGNTHVRDPAQIWGSPDVDYDAKLFGNFGKLLPSGQQLYAHGNYAKKTVTGGFNYRNPNSRSGVFSIDGGQTLLVGDMLDARDGVLDGSAHCPVVTVGSNGVPDPEALARVLADPNCFSFQEMFPGGFTPQFGGDVIDRSLVAGLRGTAGSLAWDGSVSYGYNAVDFFIFETINASLGPATPTSFDIGSYAQRDLSANLDLTYPLGDHTNLAGGLEWREEEFTIGAGQVESYQVGPLAAQGFSAASNGFNGFGGTTVGAWSRGNYAVYGDLERSASDERWTLGLAVRLEDFEDFGTTTNGKLAGLYKLTDAWRVRGSVSTGFRAPTPGQSNAHNVTTQFDVQAGELQEHGTIPPTSRVAQLRGGEPLVPEESINYALGAIFDDGPLSVTVDFYQINVDDRLTLSQNFTLTPAEIDQLLAEGITGAGDLNDFRFFVNDFDTRTRGVDVVATYTPKALRADTSFSLVLNHTETGVTRYNPETLDAVRIRQLESALPETRCNLAIHQRLPGGASGLARVSYFGAWFDAEDGQTYQGKPIVDLEGSYPVRGNLTLALGGQNVFNTYPQENPTAAAGLGNRYSQFTPFGFNGAYWYLRLQYRWDALWGR